MEPSILPGDEAPNLTQAIQAKAAELRAAEQAVRDAKARVKKLKDEIRSTRKAITAALATGVKIKRKPKESEHDTSLSESIAAATASKRKKAKD
jgi:DNA polymerase elongation subunit (family B)